MFGRVKYACIASPYLLGSTTGIKVVFPDMYSGIMAKRKFEALFYLITHNESNLVIKELFVFI